MPTILKIGVWREIEMEFQKHVNNIRTLIIGLIPDDFSPEHHIPLGPFCFLDREHIYPEWEDIEFEPDPISDPHELYEHDKNTVAYANTMLPEVAEIINKRLGTHYSLKFWRIILLPWLLMFIQTTWERHCRVVNFLERHKNETFKVCLIKDSMSWNFKDTLDFQQNAVMNPAYNEWLFSRIMENILPSDWEILWIDKSNNKEIAKLESKENEVQKIKTGNKLISGLSKYKKLLRSKYDKFALPRGGFYGVYGTSRFEKFLFSCLLRLKSESTIEQNKKDEEKGVINTDNSNLEWHFDLDKIIWKVIPLSIYNVNRYLKTKIGTKNRMSVISTEVWYDDYLQKPLLALMAENVSKIVSTQHGGHFYGTAKCCHVAQEIEYTNDYFITWGWKEQENYKGNFIDLPSPLLSKYAEKHRQKNNYLILVGTLARLYTHRFQSTPLPLQQLIYLKSKKDFLLGLREQVLRLVYYRPFPPQPGSLNDLTYCKNFIHGLNICEGDLHKQLLECKLLVLDHPGTTLNVAMAANVPMIGFWDKKAWTMCRQASSYFAALENAGVLFQTGQDAARKVNEIWDDVGGWWNQGQIQKARRDWCYQYARTSKFWWWKWAKTLWKM
jgi:putative transferase (TIGR04331 family)